MVWYFRNDQCHKCSGWRSKTLELKEATQPEWFTNEANKNKTRWLHKWNSGLKFVQSINGLNKHGCIFKAFLFQFLLNHQLLLHHLTVGCCCSVCCLLWWTEPAYFCVFRVYIIRSTYFEFLLFTEHWCSTASFVTSL